MFVIVRKGSFQAFMKHRMKHRMKPAFHRGERSGRDGQFHDES